MSILDNRFKNVIDANFQLPIEFTWAIIINNHATASVICTDHQGNTFELEPDQFLEFPYVDDLKYNKVQVDATGSSAKISYAI